MRRASLALLLLVTTAHAEDARTTLANQLAAETDTLQKTAATVNDKLVAAEQTRLHRVRAALRILHAPAADDATLDDRFAAARRRAAARLLLERDAHERDLLADEARQLRDASSRTADDTAKLPSITLPTELGRPANGRIARHFGTIEHDRAHVTLSRRGLDFEVDDHAPAYAPADGVVRYAGPIRGLDHGLVLDHGDYFTVVAKLGELAIPVGTKVARGDKLGHAQRHRIYLEVRVKVGPGGLPIDPEPLVQSR
ncbi:MAG: M23 family metallopeptidase [Deltaproteobacteria bacterium]|nr:M23 family metallopeptidase [Deltaproteobacteria bacterium]